MNIMGNLLDVSGLSSEAEQFDVLIERNGVKLERIVSFGHPTPSGRWYEQPQTEWVALLRGEATIVYDDRPADHLQAGSTLLIEPNVKHRVEQVSDDAVWLALHVMEP